MTNINHLLIQETGLLISSGTKKIILQRTTTRSEKLNPVFVKINFLSVDGRHIHHCFMFFRHPGGIIVIIQQLVCGTKTQIRLPGEQQRVKIRTVVQQEGASPSGPTSEARR